MLNSTTFWFDFSGKKLLKTSYVAILFLQETKVFNERVRWQVETRSFQIAGIFKSKKNVYLVGEKTWLHCKKNKKKTKAP